MPVKNAVRRALTIILGVVGTAAGLAVDGHDAFVTAVVRGNAVGEPGLEAPLKGLGLERDQEPTNTIA